MIQDNKKRKQITVIEGWLSIILNVVLFFIKYWAGFVSGSIALMADAWHTLSDSISSIFVLFSAKFSYRKPDKDHPFGHGRYELVSSIFIGILLIIIGLNFIWKGYEKFIGREEASYGTIAIVVTIISIVVKELLAQYAFWGYRQTNSNTLKADGWHHRSDSLSSVVILIGIIVGKYLWWIDALMSVIVSGFIIFVAYKIISQSISSIIGEGASEELEKEIMELSNKASGMDVKAHHVHVHNYVLHKEVTLHICLPPELTIDKAHIITNKIEDAIKEELMMEATTHIDPLTTSSKVVD